QPFRMKPLVYSQQDLEEYERQELEWKSLALISNTTSPYASTSFVVRNHAEQIRGKGRIVINYKKLNKITKFDGFFIPSIDSLLSRIKDHTIFNKFDDKSDFYQIQIKDDISKQLTAFLTLTGHYQWNVKAFGLKNAPQVFQKWMNSLFSHL